MTNKISNKTINKIKSNLLNKNNLKTKVVLIIKTANKIIICNKTQIISKIIIKNR